TAGRFVCSLRPAVRMEPGQYREAEGRRFLPRVPSGETGCCVAVTGVAALYSICPLSHQKVFGRASKNTADVVISDDNRRVLLANQSSPPSLPTRWNPLPWEDRKSVVSGNVVG